MESSVAPKLRRQCLAELQVSQEKFSFQLATTIEAVEALRPVWNKWPHGLATDFDYYLHTLQNDPTVLHPYTIVVYRNDIPEAMLVGQVRMLKVSTVIFSVRVPGLTARVLEIASGGRVGREHGVIDELLASQLKRVVKDGEVDLVSFHRLPLHSRLFREIQRISDLAVKNRVPHIFRYSVLSLKASGVMRPNPFSAKARHEVRRKTRIVQRAFPGRVRLQCFARPGDIEVGIADAMTVATATWQYHHGCGLSDISRMYRELYFFVRKGWLRIYVLYVDDRAGAFLIGQLRLRRFYCQHTGYHREFARFSLGSLLTAWAFEDLAAAGAEEIDLGEGGQEHNRRLGCNMLLEGTVHLYGPTVRGSCLRALFAVAQLVRFLGSRARSVWRLDRVGRLWAALLRSRRASQVESSAPRNPLIT